MRVYRSPTKHGTRSCILIGGHSGAGSATIDSLVSQVTICYTKLKVGNANDATMGKPQSVVDGQAQVHGIFIANHLLRINIATDHVHWSPLTQFYNHSEMEKDIGRTESDKHYLA